MKRFKQRCAGLVMALGLFATVANAGEVVSSAAGGWFAVDARAVKDTTWEGGVIVADETNLVLQCSMSAWGEVDGGSDVTIDYNNTTTGNAGTIAENTTAETVNWTPNASGLYTLTHTIATSGDSVVLTAMFVVPIQVGDDAWAVVTNDVCTIFGEGAMWDADEWTDGNPLAAYRTSITNVVVNDGVTSIGSQFFHKFYGLNRVTCAESVTKVGDYAFLRCNSLETMNFATTPTFGCDAFKIQAAIRMNGGTPEVYSIPAISVGDNAQRVMGKKELGDEDWTDVTDMLPEEKRSYHFFKIVVAQ